MINTSADVKVDVAAKLPKGSTAVVLVRRDKDVASLYGDIASIAGSVSQAAGELITTGTASGKPGDATTTVAGGQRIVAVGVGDAKDAAVAARQAGAIAAKQARKFKADRIAIIAPDDASVEAIVTGFVIGAFEFREYRGTAGKKKEAEALGKVQLTIVSTSKSAKKDAARGLAIGTGQNYARTIANRPGNDINPPSLAQEAQKLAKSFPSLSCRVFDEKKLAALKMGGLLGVGAGSGSPPRLIVIEHKPDRVKKGVKPLLIVGKSITFDTGGISIKPAAGMGSMIYDKCGGMAVLGLMAATAMLEIDRPIIGILAAAENMPGPDAYRPGDILRMYNGVTVDITNTDAEGRLVLADALSWGIETYKPAACVDLATLTGACVVALGERCAGAWCNDDALFDALNIASKKAGERLWRMPLGDDYRDMLKAPSADLVNSPGRLGGACTAAEFLHHFIPGNIDGTTETPWCHLDIAGPAMTDKELPLYAVGATGFGVRTLVEWVTSA